MTAHSSPAPVTGPARGPSRNFARNAVRGFAVAGAVALAGCSGMGSVADALTPDPDPESVERAERLFASGAECPRISVRDGTEVYRVFEPGRQGDAQGVRFQATLSRYARECTQTAQGTNVRIGVAGRLMQGPRGGSGSVTMPVRVAATSGGELFYSQLHRVEASVTEGNATVPWTFVDGGLTIPDTARGSHVVIYVGFDDAS